MILRHLFILLLFTFLLATPASPQTIIPAGPVSGTWDLAGSPYLVEGEITLESGNTLTIEPGVNIIFRGHYKFNILENATLRAIGTAQDTILFTAADPDSGWHGLRFRSASDSCQLFYCHIIYGKAFGDESVGGGIYCDSTDITIEHSLIDSCYADYYGGAIYCSGSTPTLNENRIANNISKGSGSGIYCSDCTYPSITNNRIENNGIVSRSSNNDRGAGIYCYDNQGPVIRENQIVHNYIVDDSGMAGIGGGVYFSSNTMGVFCENLISNNNAGRGGGVYLSNSASVSFENNHILHNRADYYGGIYCFGDESPDIINNHIIANQGGGIYITSCNDNPIEIVGNLIAENYSEGTGAGISVNDSYPIIRQNILRDNNSGNVGGAINCDYGTNDGIIEQNDIIENSADCGGGVSLLGSSNIVVKNNLLKGNLATEDRGGGIWLHNSNALFANNTIIENQANRGGGFWVEGQGSTTYPPPTIVNCIIRDNLPDQIQEDLEQGNSAVTYCDIQGNWPGLGNIDTDPLFVNPARGDYHLQSIAGSYHNPETNIENIWLPDPQHSPCIDAGDPDSDFLNEPAPNGQRSNMGAYGNTAEASKSNQKIVSDAVYGIWASGNPVLVADSIWIPPDSTLLIEEGVMVLFQGHYRFKILENATLRAIGTDQRPVMFTASDTLLGWHGIRFLSASDSCWLEHCLIEFGHASGAGDDARGGGIYSVNTNFYIENCEIGNCRADQGGALYCGNNSVANITGTQLYENQATFGGAIYLNNATGVIDHNLVIENSSDSTGAAIYCMNSAACIESNTIYANTAGMDGGGILCNISELLMNNNIIWQNSSNQITVAGSPEPSVTYSNVEGGWPGAGNIDADPLFLNPAERDFHVESVTGAYRNNVWQPDSLHSPCIDAGDPNSPFGNEPEPHGARINIGYYGNTLEASLACDGSIVSGPLQGIWRVENSPYHVIDSIFVPSGDWLTIDPGVQVLFHGHHKFIIEADATLQAIGNIDDSIHFKAVFPDFGWHGIRFLNSSDSCILQYCIVEHGLANGPGYWEARGGGIYIESSNITIQECRISGCQADASGSGIYCRHADPNIVGNVISSNNSSGGTGRGGGMALDNSNAIITDNVIDDNGGDYYGGGIACYNGAPFIARNIIKNNHADNKGAGLYFDSSTSTVTGNLIFSNSGILCEGNGIYAYFGHITLTNNTIVNNPWGGGVYCHGNTSVGLTIQNCIIYGNTPYQLYVALAITEDVSYSLIEGGWAGVGNINTDPRFTDGPLGDFYLEQFAAGQSHNSPCVDAGNPSSPMITGATRTDGVQDDGIVDMGYHYPVGLGELAVDYESEPEPIPHDFCLLPAYPNPFNPQTTIRFGLPAAAPVRVAVYDIRGCQVATLTDGWRQVGYHDVTFEAENLASGVYFYRINAADFSATGKLLLLK